MLDRVKPVLTIGISGSSSAGKTTLCALLGLILPPVLSSSSVKLVALHCDAYCKEFEDLPSRHDGILDADSRDSIDMAEIHKAVDHVILHAEAPESYQSFAFIEKDIANAQNKLRPEFVTEMQELIRCANWRNFCAVALVDGFLLYHDQDMREKLNVKLFFRTSRATAKLRRFGRYGEGAAPEGSEEFWKTESYFENCVWPNYVKEHAFMFPEGDVEASIDVLTVLPKKI
ncbi:hypothetical protein MBLNU459_g0780t1 [Dothideomycetes sp. NU459]